jgi:uroporphyrinogen decarboxylase
MFTQAPLMVKATMLPMNELSVDAAIIFKDILNLPMMMGFDIEYQTGIGPICHNVSHFDRIAPYDINIENPILIELNKAIKLVKGQIDQPLIGFAGAPLTVMSYLFKHEKDRGFQSIRNTMLGDACRLKKYMDQLTKQTINYIRHQVAAGVDVIQIFESSARHFSLPEYEQFGYPWLNTLLSEICGFGVPIIIYSTNMKSLYPLLKKHDVCLSVDISDPHDPWFNSVDHVIQGGFDVNYLYNEQSVIKQKLDDWMAVMSHRPYVFNLSHGLKPDIPYENVVFLSQYFRERYG